MRTSKDYKRLGFEVSEPASRLNKCAIKYSELRLYINYGPIVSTKQMFVILLQYPNKLSENFRETPPGLLPLDCMTYFCKQYPDAYLKVIAKNSCNHLLNY
jgi:hypothetical protein